MFDYSTTEVQGKNAADLFASKEVRTISDVIAIIDISKDSTEEFFVIKKDGSEFFVEVFASNVTTALGEHIGRMASFVDITQRKKIEADRKKFIIKLQYALETIKVLKGIIPICASCKKIRDDKGYWNEIEQYIEENTDADFSHGICPECSIRLYPEFSKLRND